MSLEWLICVMARFIYLCMPRRRAVLLRNVRTAFPHRSEAWRKKIALISCGRVVEMGLMALLTPFWSARRIRKNIKASENLSKIVRKQLKNPRPALFLVPHFSQIELITLLPACLEVPPHIGVIYRPFGSRWLENFVRRTRERFGMQLLSRKNGILRARSILAQKGCVAVLFDQNAGDRGRLTYFFDKIASSSELPDLLAKNADVYVLFTRREGFCKCTIDAECLCEGRPSDVEHLPVIHAAQRWLESKLQESPYTEDWLWLHKRWNTQNGAKTFLGLHHASIADGVWPTKIDGSIPKNTHLWVRMPNWLGDVVMALPLLRALRWSRPDMYVTLLVKRPMVAFLESLGVADRVCALPEKGWGYFQKFWQWRNMYPDAVVVWPHSLRSDIEAFLLGAPLRVGMRLHPRPLLTHAWQPNVDLNTTHQTQLGYRFLQNYGLKAPLDLMPVRAYVRPDRHVFGLICGTENFSEKRWPVEHWRTLINKILSIFPEARCRCFGTQKDAPIVAAVADGFERVENWAGKTDLPTFAHMLMQCTAIIGNDTGGVHLANALGVPTVVIYGPTNVLRTGLIFDAPKNIVTTHTPPARGDIRRVDPEQVYDALRHMCAAV